MMKIPYFLAFFLILFSVKLYADPSFGAGLGVEVNGYSQSLIGVGGMGGMDYRFGEMFSFGVRGLYTLDLGPTSESMSVLELTGNLRWYFLRFEKWLTYYYILQNKYHVFAQLDIGGALVYIGDDDVAISGLSFGLSAGVRIMLFDWSAGLYLEPYLRYSSTSIFGIGLMVGWVVRPNEY